MRSLGAIALLALLVRALVPAGYMLAPSASGDGGHLVLQMCDGHGAAPKVISLETGEEIDQQDLADHDAPEGQSGSSPCVFGAATYVAARSTAAEHIVFPVRETATYIIAAEIRPARGIASPLPPATGPPGLI